MPIVLAGAGVDDAQTVREPVETTQIAPTILRLLGSIPASSRSSSASTPKRCWTEQTRAAPARQGWHHPGCPRRRSDPAGRRRGQSFAAGKRAMPAPVGSSVGAVVLAVQEYERCSGDRPDPPWAQRDLPQRLQRGLQRCVAQLGANPHMRVGRGCSRPNGKQFDPNRVGIQSGPSATRATKNAHLMSTQIIST